MNDERVDLLTPSGSKSGCSTFTECGGIGCSCFLVPTVSYCTLSLERGTILRTVYDSR